MNNTQCTRQKQRLEALIANPASTPDEIERARRRLAKLEQASCDSDEVEVCEPEAAKPVQTTNQTTDKPCNLLREYSAVEYRECRTWEGYPKDATEEDHYLFNLLLGGSRGADKILAFSESPEGDHLFREMYARRRAENGGLF